MQKIRSLFTRPSLAQVNAESLTQAQYELAQHKAAAEFHAAMIVMYQARVARIAAESTGAA